MGSFFLFFFFSWLTDIVAKYSRGFVTVYWWGVAKDICGLENPLPMQNKTLNLKTMKWLFKRPQKAPALSSWDSPMGITRTAAYFFFCWDFLYQWETSWSSGAWKYSSCSLDKRYHDQRKQNCLSAIPEVLHFFKRSRENFSDVEMMVSQFRADPWKSQGKFHRHWEVMSWRTSFKV